MMARSASARSTRNASISSAGSLTFSEYSAFSFDDCLRTPPPNSPRAYSPASFTFDDSPCSISSQSSIGEEDDWHSPLKREVGPLHLEVPEEDALWGFGSSSSPTRSSTIAITAPSPPPKPKMKKRPSNLKMDLSTIRRFEPSPPTGNLLGAPLIGCLPTPSPTTLNFNITPRPGLVSRFSDESPSPVNDRSLPFSSNNPSSARASVPAAHHISSNAWPSPQPITPRTVDALDSFGITSNVSSCLMRRAGSRGEAKASSPLSRSPENMRNMPRSPLGMPLHLANGSSRMAPGMARHRSASSPLVDAKQAQALYHSLLPGATSSSPRDEFEAELACTPPALNTPFEWVHEHEASLSAHKPHQRSISNPADNPYFMYA